MSSLDMNRIRIQHNMGKVAGLPGRLQTMQQEIDDLKMQVSVLNDVAIELVQFMKKQKDG